VAPAPGEQGSATVITLGAVGVLVLVMVGGVALGSAVAAMHRARSAADLGALAAAGTLAASASPLDACAAGAEVVRANRATQTSCRTYPDGSVILAVAVPPALVWPGLDPTARATARAGPAP
jgi:secretion/DNA translocation related TadE-like protein